MSFLLFFFSSRRRHTRCLSDWSSDVCSSDLYIEVEILDEGERLSRHGGWADVGNLRVAAPYRRQGVGSWLLGQAADWRSEERRVGKEDSFWWSAYDTE